MRRGWRAPPGFPANTAVLARSGSGKSFATKLGVLRGIARGDAACVIDPEGEYAPAGRAGACSPPASPGIPRHT